MLVLTLGTALAVDLLSLDFDDPGDPWLDGSPNAVTLTPTTFTDFEFTGTGVVLDPSTPSPGGGTAAYFDGGSSLDLGPEAGFVIDAGQDFMLSFWFRTPGIHRPTSPGHHERMHFLGWWGPDRTGTFDVTVDDGGTNGLIAYWNGSSSVDAGGNTLGLYTDDQWHQLLLSRESGLLTLCVRHLDGSIDVVGTRFDNNAIGRADPDAIGSIGRWATDHGSWEFGYLGWMDQMVLSTDIDHPQPGPIDWCPDIPGTQWQDADSDFIGDLCDDCTDPDGDGECNPEAIPFLGPLPFGLLAFGLGLGGLRLSAGSTEDRVPESRKA